MASKLKCWEAWEKWQAYNTRLNYYAESDTNWDMYFGDQYPNADLDPSFPKPTMNYIKRDVVFFVASVTQNATKGVFENVITEDEENNTDDILNEEWERFVEDNKLDRKLRSWALDGAVTGDYVAHMVFDKDSKPFAGKLSMETDEQPTGIATIERVSPENFGVANPQEKDVQKQAYIQIGGRDPIKQLKEEQKESSDIVSEDTNTSLVAGKYGKVEIEDTEGTGKANYVITYEKREGKVFASKTLEGEIVIYKDVDTGLERYPVALGNWEEQPNTTHGMSFVKQAVPTQIYINKCFALSMVSTQNHSFPKLMINESMIKNWSSKPNGVFKIKNVAPGTRLTDAAAYLQTGEISGSLPNMLEMAKNFMQETIGASDALLGNVDTEQASGVSISVASKQAAIPQENIKANLYSFVEDIMLIFLDMVSNNYGLRPVLVENEDGGIIQGEFDFDTLKESYKRVKINVGPSTYWNELAISQTMDNLLERQLITFKEWLEGPSGDMLPNKSEILARIDKKQKQEEENQTDLMDNMTPEEQQQFDQLPLEQQEEILQGMQLPTERKEL